MASGVGGSYTKWQAKPPAHKVIMVQHEDIENNDKWTTIKAYDVSDREIYDEDVIIESGSDGPDGIPFAHDVDFEDLTDEAQTEIREYAINEFAE